MSCFSLYLICIEALDVQFAASAVAQQIRCLISYFVSFVIYSFKFCFSLLPRAIPVPPQTAPPGRIVNLCQATQPTILTTNPMLQGALLMQQMQGMV